MTLLRVVGETNMWEQVARKVINGEVDVLLHAGDQVSADNQGKCEQLLSRDIETRGTVERQ